MTGLFNRLWNGYKEYIVLVLLLIVSLFCISISNKPAAKKVKAYSFGAFSYITSAFSKIIEPFQTNFENRRLRGVNAQLMLEVNRLREYGIQNEELKKLIILRDTSDYPLIAAKVISKHLTTSYSDFVLNSGSKDGIRVGMPVINDQGLVGIISTVYSEFSIIRTLRSRELKFAIKNQRSRFDGILEWNGTELTIMNVPKTYDMEVGDRIITSDFSTKFPPSIPVGIVSGGTRDKTGIFNNISVKPFVDFIRLENVFVIAFVPSFKKDDIELNLTRNK